MADFNEIFTKMEEKMASFNASNSKGIDAIIQYNVSGDNGGHFYVQVDDGTLSLNKAAHENPNINFYISGDDLNDMLEGRLNGGAAMLTGKLKIKGNMKLLTKLRKVIA